MYKLEIAGMKIPDLYVCSNDHDASYCRTHKIPYIIWHKSKKQLIARLMYRSLCMRFPGIDWETALDIEIREQEVVHVPGNEGEDIKHEELDAISKKKFKQAKSRGMVKEMPAGSTVTSGGKPVKIEGYDDSAADIADEQRGFDCNIEAVLNDMSIDAYVGDMRNCITIDIIEALDLMPKAMSSMYDAIHKTTDYEWQDNFNKKLGLCVGNCVYSSEKKNLIIVDVSGSIPRGISDTLLNLVETMRSKSNADIIITGSISLLYRRDDVLPSPDELRKMVGLGNESHDFKLILDELCGEEYGTVVAYGDLDHPIIQDGKYHVNVDNIVGYHTGYHPSWLKKGDYYDLPGYVRCFARMNPGANIEKNFGGSWCRVFK